MDSEIQLFSTNTQPTFTSIKPDNEADKIKLLNALENADFMLNDVAPLDIEVKDVYIQQYEKEIEGEKRTKYRTILFSNDGKTYVTTSTFFFYSLSKIFNVMGTPDKWNKTYTLSIYKKDIKNGRKALSVKIKA